MQADMMDPSDLNTSSELNQAAATTGGSNFRCTRGGCNDVIGHPVNQDSHNQSKHMLVRAGDRVVDSITKGISGESAGESRGMQSSYLKNLDDSKPTQTLWDEAGDNS